MDRWQQVSRLYHDARARAAGERAAFLLEACAGDETLRREVESLLANESRAAGFLSDPAVDVAAKLMQDDTGASLIGRQIAGYQILSLLGTGGMGEVYCARDVKLGREVAIKVLPASLAADPERLRRFEREARLLAALNHPHIATIHGLEDFTGVPALVMELVEGPTLAERLAQGSGLRAQGRARRDGGPGLKPAAVSPEPGRARMRGLPLDEAMAITRQIAEALEAAHEKGIIHCDLKPANIILQGARGPTRRKTSSTARGDPTPARFGPQALASSVDSPPRLADDIHVKVLDFGLAKAFAGDGSGSDVSQLPTITTTEARNGAIVGTPAYMSPEQARGQAIDKRTDIWAFGCVLYEMLTGRVAFRGETISDTIAAILEREPEWGAMPEATPAGIRRLLRRCLEKNPRERLHDIADARLEIKESLTVPEQPLPPAAPKRRWVVAALGLTLGALTVGAIGARTLWWTRPASTSLVRVHRLTELTGLEEFPALSPDGRSVAFTADMDGKRQLWVRLIAGGPALQITRDPADHLYPRWSRDSGSLVYFSPPREKEEAGPLWAISALGGPARRLGSTLSGADVSSADDRLAFFRLGTKKVELVVAKLDGSDLRVMVELEPGYTYGTPRWSPDGRVVAYERRYYGTGDEIFAIRDGEARPTQLTRTPGQLSGFAWLADGSGIVFSSSRGNSILYLPTFQLWTLRFDDGRVQQLTYGEASYTHPDLGHAGVLVSSRLRMRSDLWRFPVDGDGAENVRRAAPVTRQTAEVRTPSVSPDGREVVYVSDVGGHSNLWVTKLDTGEPRQLTFERDPGVQIGVPVWSPNGRPIAFYWNEVGGGTGYSSIQPDGSDLRRILSEGWWACWSPDGRWLYYQDQQGAPARQLKKIPIEGGLPTTVRIESATMPALSPDGKTLYFAVEVLQESGAVDYEIRSASPEDGPSRVLARIPGHRLPDAGRFHPVISPDGRWLALPLNDGTTTNIWAVATADGATRALTDFGNRPMFISRRVSWSPDGLFIYAAVSEGDADVVLLDGLRP